MTYASEVLADAPLIYWRLDEPSGTAATDASGNGNDGTYYESPTLGVSGLLASDPENTAVTFVDIGGGQRVESNDTPVPVGTLPVFAVECWFDVPATGAGQLIAVADPAEVAPDLIEVGYLDGVINFDFQGTSSYSPTVYAAAVGVRHLVAVYDGTALALYVDGVAIGNEPFADAGAVQTVANAVAAAHFPGGGAIGANGTLDEVAVYTSGLSAERVLAHYDAGASAGNLYTPPIAYDMGPIIPDTQGLQRLLFRHYSPHGRFQTVWKLATNPITYSLTQPYPLITPEDVNQGNMPIGQQYTEATYLHVYYGPELVDADEAARLVASGIGTVT